MDLTEFPEHEKLQKVKEHSQYIHDFVHWLQAEHKVFLASYLKSAEKVGQNVTAWSSEMGDRIEVALPFTKQLTDLVAEFLEIDQVRLENEKRKMLDLMQVKHEAPPAETM